MTARDLREGEERPVGWILGKAYMRNRAGPELWSIGGILINK